MNYKEAINYLYNALPQFQRIGAPAYKAGLDTSYALDKLYNYPHRSFKSIHVAGTNGKGSTSQMIYQALRDAGHSVGLYTSPHLIDFRERIVVDGIQISKQAVVDFTQKLMANDDIKPSFFEMTVALAFDYFRNCGVQYAVVEVGMGGRLDSTNIITPIVSVITNISLDHTQFLGSTIEQIATEKAGIIKDGIPVVIGQTQSECTSIFIDKAAQVNAPIIFADQLLAGAKYSTSMEGYYQAKNSITAAAALQTIGIEERYIKSGIQNARVRGRWEILSNKPLIVCDTGHNEDGIRYIAAQIAAQKYDKLYFIMGVVSDKDIAHILPLLPRDANYIFTQASVERAMPYQVLADAAIKFGLKGQTAPTVVEAYAMAQKMARANDMIFIGGSTFTVADLLASLQK